MPSPAPHGRALSTLRFRRLKKRSSPFPKKLFTKPPLPEYMRATIHKISTTLRYSTWDAAATELRALPLHWDSFTVNRILKTHPPMEKAWLFFHWAARLPGFKHDRFTYTTMLDIFGEAGRIPSMWHVFREMEDKGVTPDAATYTSVMHWLSAAGDLQGAVRAWEEMRERGCRPTLVSYTAFMKILFDHGRPKEAAGVYTEMLEVGLSPNCHTYTVLMEYLAGAGKFKAALKIMSEMQEAGIEPDKAACNILIQKCSKAGETSAMRQVLLYMKEHSIVLRRTVFMEALEALKLVNGSDHLLRENFIAVEHMLSGMINRYIELDAELISMVIQLSCANYKPSCVLMAFRYSLQVGKELDRSAYISLLGFFMRENALEMVLEIVHEMTKAGVSFGTYLVYLLIYRLGRARIHTYAESIFYSLPMDQNVVTYTALMDALFQAGEVDKGLELYSKMRKDISISSGTYEVLILGLEKYGRIDDAEFCRKEKMKFMRNKYPQKDVSPDEILCNYLFDGIS
ncbi:PPR repeat, partial [Musa troglodytarum]